MLKKKEHNHQSQDETQTKKFDFTIGSSRHSSDKDL
jgi:hypothetical protein